MACGSSLCSSMASKSISNFVNRQILTNFSLLRNSTPSTVAFSRRRNNHPGAVTGSTNKDKQVHKKQKGFIKGPNGVAEEDLEDDPFEALFSMLEEDLKNDDSVIDDEEEIEIKEEDIDRLASEFAEAFGGFGNGTFDDDQELEEAEEPVKLKGWQLRRLGYALKSGRRKASIKHLAAELCLDRSLVLKLLRDPPPDLLVLSAKLPDEPAPAVLFPETKPVDAFEDAVGSAKATTKLKEPVHVMQHQWSAQKRLKKAQVDTLEKVYRRSKRPTNAIISSIVQVTNLPRKKVLKWFEDKRNEEGVPDHHAPYQRTVTETVFPRKVT